MHKKTKDPAHQAFLILQVTFVIAPIVAGLDKFFNLLTNWSQYLSPFVSNIIGHHDQGFMMFAGVIEIVAGIGVLLKPRIFAYIVSLWLLGILLNLLLTGLYFDIALRDLGLCLAALSLGKLSQKYAK
jgi:uncharacterized membrane protein YphA (DoxX/SURF4 family)